MARPWAAAVAAAVAAKAYETLPQWERDADVLETLEETFGAEALAALDPDYDQGEPAALYASPWGADADRYDEDESPQVPATWRALEAVRYDQERLRAKWRAPYGRALSGARLIALADAWQECQDSPWWRGQAVQGWR